jgi:hypothetical protein
MTTGVPSIERAIVEAERLRRKALRRYERGARVLGGAQVRRAVRSMHAARDTMDAACQVLARAVCRRLGIAVPRVSSPDAHDSPTRTLHDILHGFGIVRGGYGDPAGMLGTLLDEVPRRSSLDEVFVTESRTIFDAFAFAGRLAPRSEDDQRMREYLLTEYKHLVRLERRPRRRPR